MIKVAVCDDQKNVREDICEKVKKQKKEKCMAEAFQSGEELLKAMEEEYYDIYFLDIELSKGGMDGYQLAQEIRRREPAVVLIFLSGHEEYACEAFEVGALRFLRKPVVEEKFAEAFGKAVDMALKGKQIFSYVADYKDRQIAFREIAYFETVGRKMILHKGTGEQEIFYGTLKSIQKKIQGKHFELCHKSYLINLEYVKELAGDQIVLVNGEKLPISRKHKKAIRESYTDYMIMVNREGIY